MKKLSLLLLLATTYSCSGENNTNNSDNNDDSGVINNPDSSVTPDSGTATDSGSDGGFDSGQLADASNICGEVTVTTNPTTPNVVLIVDESGSMQDPFTETSSRWQALKDYLLADNGLIKNYQSTVNFGVALFSGTGPLGETCPYVNQVPVSPNNFNAINNVYGPALPLNNTPTGDSINKVIDSLTPSDNPTIFILATDGEPDTCEQPWPQEGQQESIDAVKRAYSLGIKTYVIAVTNASELSEKHINDLANAGQGTESGSESYRVDTDLGLSTVLNDIVSGAISCTVPVVGKVTTPDPCSGQITLNGVELSCGSDNGWSFNNNAITLNGEACTKLKLGGVLEAVFPCDTIYVH